MEVVASRDAFKASRWEFFIALQWGNIKWRHNTFLDFANRQGQATLHLQNPLKVSPSSSNPLFKEKYSSSHHHGLSCSLSFPEHRSGDACTRGQRFWRITRNSFPPWMENNKGIPHDRPLFLSSAGHKSSDLLLEHPHPPPLLLPFFITTRLQKSHQVIWLTNYRQTGSLRVWAKVKNRQGTISVVFGGEVGDFVEVYTIKYSVWLLFTQ